MTRISSFTLYGNQASTSSDHEYSIVTDIYVDHCSSTKCWKSLASRQHVMETNCRCITSLKAAWRDNTKKLQRLDHAYRSLNFSRSEIIQPSSKIETLWSPELEVRQAPSADSTLLVAPPHLPILASSSGKHDAILQPRNGLF